jgi:pyruvate dehydrogenase E2 component (dihydrolipoamide acetyltransferase)
MPTPFIMPKFDMDQETATVVEWLKQEGDHIEKYEEVLIVETDKVAIEVQAPATGKLARITAKAGDVVPVTAIIAYVLSEGESAADLPPAGLHSGNAGDLESRVAQRLPMLRQHLLPGVWPENWASIWPKYRPKAAELQRRISIAI